MSSTEKRSEPRAPSHHVEVARPSIVKGARRSMLLARAARRSGRGGGRSRVIAEARRLFSSRDYSDVSMQDVAQAAGVTKAALYYHFVDKTDLYFQVLLAQIEEIRRDVDEAIGSEGTLEDRLVRVATLAQQRFETDVMGLMMAAHKHLDDKRHLEVHAALNGVQDGVARCFEEDASGAAQGRAIPPSVAAALFFTLTATVALQNEARVHGHPSIEGLPVTPVERAKLAVHLFLDGYRGARGG